MIGGFPAFGPADVLVNNAGSSYISPQGKRGTWGTWLFRVSEWIENFDAELGKVLDVASCDGCSPDSCGCGNHRIQCERILFSDHEARPFAKDFGV